MILRPQNASFARPWQHAMQRAIRGYEAMHMLRKGQLEGLAKRGVLAQNRNINQLFGLVA